MFGKELFIQFTASAFRKLLSVYVFSYFPFGFEGRKWDLIVSVPDHCLFSYFIDTRQHLWTGIRAAFSGLSVIAVGDLYQLKPVGDRPFFLNLDEDAKALAPNLWVDHFKMYEISAIMRQKEDFKFAQLLNRLRLNEMSEDDKNELRKRVVDRHLGDYPRDAVHLFAEKAGVFEHSENIMNHMEVEKLLFHAMTLLFPQTFHPKRHRSLLAKSQMMLQSQPI